MAVILFAYLIQVTIHDHEYQKKTSSLNHDLFLSTRRRRPNENPPNGEMMSWETKRFLICFLLCFVFSLSLSCRPANFRSDFDVSLFLGTIQQPVGAILTKLSKP